MRGMRADFLRTEQPGLLQLTPNGPEADHSDDEGDAGTGETWASGAADTRQPP